MWNVCMSVDTYIHTYIRTSINHALTPTTPLTTSITAITKIKRQQQEAPEGYTVERLLDCLRLAHSREVPFLNHILMICICTYCMYRNGLPYSFGLRSSMHPRCPSHTHIHTHTAGGRPPLAPDAHRGPTPRANPRPAAGDAGARHQRHQGI